MSQAVPLLRTARLMRETGPLGEAGPGGRVLVRLAVPAGTQQRAERGRARRLPERDDLPHPGTVRALGGEFGQRSRGDQHPRAAGVEPGGDVRRARIGPDQAGAGARGPDRVDRDGRAGRVLDEHAGRVTLGQAAPGQAVRGRPDSAGEPRPRGHRAVGGVDEGGTVAGPVRDFQDARGQGTVRRARALQELVCLRAFPDTDTAFHPNLQAALFTAGGSWRGTGPARPLPQACRFPPPLGNQAGTGYQAPAPPRAATVETLGRGGRRHMRRTVYSGVRIAGLRSRPGVHMCTPGSAGRLVAGRP